MKNIVFIISMLLLINCSEEQLDLKDFYFPLKSLEEGKVYLYKDIGTGIYGKEYWFLKSFKQKDGYELHITILNKNVRPTQSTIEMATSEEMKTVSTTLIERNAYEDELPVDVMIKQPYVFNLEMADTSKSLYSNIVWINPIDSLEYTLEKVRYFKGFSKGEVMGEQYRLLNMGVNTIFKSFTPKDGETSSDWPGDEVYAKGLGMVYYKRAIDPSMIKEMKLSKIYGLKEFNRLKNVDLK